ncbi:GyrI-like domain-containing protein [Rhizobium sp. Root1220]|uniref:GyrI-like domain-containing protein n=1 Tax=Rhizobium sp. Root1220 TaxID=1736432 RepID=UPI0006F49827|nr:GyrI-like domain-containing protein [Rhizobium sp. Root1220]KQV80506.1 hypothetical protein ASC90_25220 [Rhizobium sp. Root1220]
MLTLPKIIQRPEQRYVAVRRDATIPFGEIVGPAYDELFATLSDRGESTTGLPFIKYNRIAMPHLEIEIGIVTGMSGSASGTLLCGVLPAGRYATTTYTGPYDDLMDVTAVLVGWAKQVGLEWDMRSLPDGDRFSSRVEFYENDPSAEPDPLKLVTTLMFKLADATG